MPTLFQRLEKDEQKVFAQWLTLQGVRWIIQQRMDKRSNLMAGTPDHLFVLKGKPFAIELKKKGEKPREKQIEAMKKMTLDGWHCAWFDSGFAAIEHVKNETK